MIKHSECSYLSEDSVLHSQWKWKSLNHVWLFVTLDLYSPWYSPVQNTEMEPFPSPGHRPNTGIKPRSPTLQAVCLPVEPQGKPKNTGMGNLSLLQRIFPTQDLLHCRWILYQLSYQGSPLHFSWASTALMDLYWNGEPMGQVLIILFWSRNHFLYVSFSFWLVLLSRIISRSIHVSENENLPIFKIQLKYHFPMISSMIPIPKAVIISPSPEHSQSFFPWSLPELSCSVMSDSLRPHGLQPARVICP